MSEKPQLTLADYVVVALSPALIIVMVGALVMFLLDVGYAGAYEARLGWILGLYVVGAVLIGRIAIDSGGERASLFALALAGAVLFALIRFVDAWIPAAGLLAVVWWAAHQITWDCTHIDEEAEEEAEGLLQASGLEPEKTPSAEPVEARHSEPGDSEKKKQKPPGRWILFFALAALPIFGLGQVLIPSDDGARGRVFFLFTAYLAAAMGLLATTSFLGLRRRLRRQGLQMPTSVTAAWLTAAALVGLSVLIVGALAPRPGTLRTAATAWERLSGGPRSASRTAAQASDGGEGEGAQGGQSADAPPPSDDKSGGGQAAGQSESGSSRGDSDDSSDSRGNQADQQDAKSRDDSSGSGDQGNSQGQPSDRGQQSDGDEASSQRGEEESGDASSNAADSSESDSTEADSRIDRGRESSESDERGDSPPPENDRSDDEESEAQSDAPKDSESESSSTSQSAQSPPAGSSLLDSLRLPTPPPWLKWAIAIAAAVGIALLFGRQIIEGVAAAFAQLMAWLRGESAEEPSLEDPPGQPEEKPTPVRPFSSFRDPFSSGAAAGLSDEELIDYTLAAAEAWGAERGVARGGEATELEYAAELAAAELPEAAAVRTAAALATYVRYGSGRLEQSDRDALREVWNELAGV